MWAPNAATHAAAPDGPVAPPPGKDVLASYKWIDIHTPRDLEIHVVLDNLSAHRSAEVTEWLAKPAQRRWHLHFMWTKTAKDIITKVKRGRAALTHQTKSATDH